MSVPLLSDNQLNILLKVIIPQYKPIIPMKEFRKTILKILSQYLNKECVNPINKDIMNIIKTHIPFHPLKYLQCMQLSNTYYNQNILTLFWDKNYIPIYRFQDGDTTTELLLVLRRKVRDSHKKDKIVRTLDNDILDNKKYKDDIQNMFRIRNYSFPGEIELLGKNYPSIYSSYKPAFNNESYPQFKSLIDYVSKCMDNQRNILIRDIKKYYKNIEKYHHQEYIPIVGLYYDLFSEETLSIIPLILRDVPTSFNNIPRTMISHETDVFMENLYKYPYQKGKKYTLDILRPRKQIVEEEDEETEILYRVLISLTSIKDEIFEGCRTYSESFVDTEQIRDNPDIEEYQKKYRDDPEFEETVRDFEPVIQQRFNGVYGENNFNTRLNWDRVSAQLVLLYVLNRLNIPPSHPDFRIYMNIFNYKDIGHSLMLIDLASRTRVSPETWEFVKDVIDRDSIKTDYNVFMVYIYRLQCFHITLILSNTETHRALNPDRFSTLPSSSSFSPE